MSDTTIHLLFDGLPAPITFEPEAADIARFVAGVLRGWPVVEAPDMTPLATVSLQQESFLVERHDTGWRLPQQTEVSAVCQVVVEIVDLLVHSGSRYGALHAAAIAVEDRLILIPAKRRAGKSTLIAALAARGAKIVADDLVLFDRETGEMIATGCLPRLRLPLPENAAPELQDFVDANTVLSDGYYAYLDPGQANNAAHGGRFRLGAILVPERREEMQRAVLDRLSGGDALLGLLSQDTSRERDSADLIAFHGSIARSVPAFRLTYSEPVEAASAILGAFQPQASAWLAPLHEPEEAQFRPAAMGDGPLRPSQGVFLQEVGDRAFLARAGTGEIHHVDAIGRAVWLLAESGEDEAGIAACLQEAFPDADPARIAGDVARIVCDFIAEGLLARANQSA